ncbi:MAG: hypothetical protein HKO85_06370 [Xanthomonadales bacterium]|nr:hypothetical protein [Gammaproteobacteria bacterium]MBT8051129.1 hypothetical protein [Gammaproteobacteria bacterium]MBT8057005.1 hypothetical protein [Gammaproteobacteria bacterium]NNJ77692.1 hypothetical protein [Xanthomonadales bacterium]NNL04895.1 hypothetical protein [Xanthomonadales bacterium]
MAAAPTATSKTAFVTPPGKRGSQGLYLTVGVTGHRNLVAAEVPVLRAHLAELFRGLKRDFPGLPLQLITPLAEGADQLAAEVALSEGVSIVTVLPMVQAEYERDFTTPEAVSAFRAMLEKSDEIIVLPPVKTGLQTPYSAHDRALQYAQLGVFTSDHTQVLLALWDGKPCSKIGGTGQVVHYHLTGVMEGFDGDPTPAGLLADNENDLVYHLVCSRDQDDGSPVEGKTAGEAWWFSSREEVEPSYRLPDLYREMLGRLERFARDWQEKPEVIRSRGYDLLADAPDALEKPSGAWLTNTLFQVADGLAIHYQRRVFGSLRAMHMMAILMGVLFLVYSEFDGPDYMVLVFLGMFFAGVVLYLIGSNHQWHRKYLDYRTLAEGLRVQLYWSLSGVVEEEWAGFAYDNFLVKQDADLGWVRHAMRQASMYRIRGVSPDPAWLSWVVAQWVGDANGEGGQLQYYSRKESQNTARFRRTQRLGSLCLWIGIATAASMYFLGPIATEDQQNLLLVLMGLLPLVAGIWDAYSHKKAEKELIKQYGFMRRVFGKAQRLVNESSDLAFKRQVLRALGQAALDEGAEWLLIHRERPLEHGRLG